MVSPTKSETISLSVLSIVLAKIHVKTLNQKHPQINTQTNASAADVTQDNRTGDIKMGTVIINHTMARGKPAV